jgi:hypothetical protein
VKTIPTQVVRSSRLSQRPPHKIREEFEQLLDGGMPIDSVGKTRKNPRRLLAAGYVPLFKAELFDTTFYFSSLRQNPDIRFLVTYVVQPSPRLGERVAHPRLFYKDASLIWRSASHFTKEWIGKGDIKWLVEDGEENAYSAEETTDLPYEIQDAAERVCRKAKVVPRDDKALGLVLREGPVGRVPAYRDFTEPRRRAAENPRNVINRGKPIAYFLRKNDPDSLRFVAGYEPDFRKDGLLEVTSTKSRLYGGRVRRFRFLSRNRRVQYLIMAAPRQVWIIPPQALTTELTTYGVRSIDVAFDEDLCVPGYEYHLIDDSVDPPELISQIPEGYAGEMSTVEEGRADASAWLDALPVIKEFRRKVLRNRR